MFKPRKIIVIGGNAAGPAAAAKAKRVNPDAEVLMFESGDYISTGTCEIPYVLSGEISGFEEIIIYTPEDFRKEKGVKVFTNCKVLDINRVKKTIRVYNGKIRKEYEESYDSLILATGSIPVKIPGFPEFSPNVFNLKNIADLQNVMEFIKSRDISSIVIFGSGYIGLEAADALQKRGIDVTLIEKAKLPLPYTEPEVSKLILELLNKNKIVFHGGYKKMSLNSADGFIRSVNIDGRILEPGLIISAVGFSPDNKLAIEAGLKISGKGGIKVDRTLKTSDSNILACGDNIEIINKVTGKNDYFPTASIAHDFAHIAGENAAGGSGYTEPVVKNIAVKIINKFQVSVGITEAEAKENLIPCKSVKAEAPNIVKVMPGSEQVFGKIVYHAVNKQILGAVFFGGREIAGYGDLISSLIKLKVSADFLGRINYNYTPPLSPLINLLSILGRKVK